MNITLSLPDEVVRAVDAKVAGLHITRHKALVRLISAWSNVVDMTMEPVKTDPSTWPVREIAGLCLGCTSGERHCRNTYEYTDYFQKSEQQLAIKVVCRCLACKPEASGSLEGRK